MKAQNTGLLLAGSALIVIGALSLLSMWLDINWFGLICPTALILLGIGMLLRPRQVGIIGNSNLSFIGEIERSGSWQPKSESFLAFVGDFDLDLTQADLQMGETNYSVTGFVVDADIFLPADVGAKVVQSGFVSEIKVQGRKNESFLAPLTWVSENYETAERKVRIDAVGFVTEVKIRQV